MPATLSHDPPAAESPRHWLMGSAYHAQRDPLTWIPRWMEEYGDVFTIHSPLGCATVVGDPRLAHQMLVERYPRYIEKGRSYALLRILMGNGLVTSSGEFWRGQRKLTQPAFHRRRLDAIFRMMVESSENWTERLAGRTEPVDVAPLFSQLTLEVISRAMFSTDVGDGAEVVGEYIATLNEGALRMLRQPWRFLLPRNVATPFTAREVRARRELDRIVRGIIARRRGNPDEHDDLLAMFLSAWDEETGRGMTDTQLRDEVMTMFVAGHETTANAMCWLLHLVSVHAEVAERLRDEIDGAGDALSEGRSQAFPYVRAVIDESLRLYPTIWSIGRRCVESDELGGFRIPAGRPLLIPIFQFHRDPRWWDEPSVFRPARFLGECKPPADAYIPFGAGPRVCIGNQFALQELVIMTVTILKRFRVEPVPGFPVEAAPWITLRPRFGMKLRFVPRALGM